MSRSRSHEEAAAALAVKAAADAASKQAAAAAKRALADLVRKRRQRPGTRLALDRFVMRRLRAYARDRVPGIPQRVPLLLKPNGLERWMELQVDVALADYFVAAFALARFDLECPRTTRAGRAARSARKEERAALRADVKDADDNYRSAVARLDTHIANLRARLGCLMLTAREDGRTVSHAHIEQAERAALADEAREEARRNRRRR